MTVQDTTRKAGPFDGNNVTTNFPFDFKVFTTSDLYVVKLNESTGIQTVLSLGTDYSVTLNFDQDSDAGGVVTLPTALPTGYSLTLTSNVADDQEVKLTNQGGFLPNVLNNVFDKSTIQIQQLKVDLNRSFKIPLSSNASAEWPTPESLKIPRWNATGDAIEYIEQGSLPGIVDAENVKYTPPWAGAVATTQYQVNQRVYNFFDVLTNEEKNDISSFAGLIDITSKLENFINNSSNKKIILPSGLYNIGVINIDNNCDIDFQNALMKLIGSNAGFRIAGSFSYLRFNNFYSDGTGDIADLQKGIYSGSSSYTVDRVYLSSPTARNISIGIETSSFLQCQIDSPKILTTVGTASGTGYGIVGAGGNGNIQINNPYFYRTTRHGLYFGNTVNATVNNPMFVEHAFGETTQNGRSALAISRGQNISIVNPLFYSCADESIGIDDSADVLEHTKRIQIIGGQSTNPQGACCALRIGDFGSQTIDNGQDYVHVSNYQIEANPSSNVVDVQFQHGNNVYVDVIINGDKNYSSGKSFSGFYTADNNNIYCKLSGVSTGSASTYAFAIPDSIATGSQKISLMSEVENLSAPVFWTGGSTPTNSRLVVQQQDLSVSRFFKIAAAASSTNGHQVEIEGGQNGYGAGISFQSRTDVNVNSTEMARIVARGTAAWNSTSSNQDAEIAIFATLNGSSTEIARVRADVGSGSTPLYLLDPSSGTIKNVEVGANDSGGTGYKLLRIAN